ncbi:MAG: hypothetical protein SNJ77_00055 [Cytophagales bacterium]
MKKLLIYFLFLPCFIFAQTAWQETHHCNAKFCGKEKFQITQSEGEKTRNGKYFFFSNPQRFVKNDTFQVSDLFVSGFYQNNLKTGKWQVKLNHFFIHEEIVKRQFDVKLTTTMTGSEKECSVHFKQDLLNGNVELFERQIAKERYGIKNKILKLFFDSDTLKGDFFFNFNNRSIKGKTNDEGFLEGWLEMFYKEGNNKIFEKRKYENGFLIELEKKDMASQEVQVKIEYSEVKELLEKLKEDPKRLNYKISQQYFGTKFNIGYPTYDARLTQQSEGNSIMEDVFLLSDSIYGFLGHTKKKNIVLKLTRRFQYVYDTTEKPIISRLKNACDSLNSSINQFLSKPSVMLRRNMSDSINKKCLILALFSSKLDTISKVVDKIESGYFDFRQREKYYESGVPGLHKTDSIEMTNAKISVKIEPLIDRSDNLLQNLDQYFQDLKKQSLSTIKQIKMNLVTYENQEIIDSLEQVISKNEKMLQENYIIKQNLSQSEASKLSFSNKLFLSLNERVVTPLKTKYINNSLPQTEVISLANNLICYYGFLNQQKKQLDRIGEMSKFWNDSLFTLYKDNPFDFRKLESKILENIQNASNILLFNYATLLLNAKTCEQVNAEFNKIMKLNSRVRTLVKNHQNEKVLNLNKAIRRERVPGRIEKYLDL